MQSFFTRKLDKLILFCLPVWNVLDSYCLTIFLTLDFLVYFLSSLETMDRSVMAIRGATRNTKYVSTLETENCCNPHQKHIKKCPINIVSRFIFIRHNLCVSVYAWDILAAKCFDVINPNHCGFLHDKWIHNWVNLRGTLTTGAWDLCVTEI